MKRLFWLILLPLFLLSGCVSVQSLNSAGPYDIHHHTWWNYYQRGRLYLKDKRFAEAQKDFETALGRIPGARYPYTEERWRARTYGMHMIEGYFPHRELGICLYEQGEAEQALALLETSMQMEPSARAKFYINLIRKQQADAATLSPSIRLTALPAWTSQPEVAIEGSVTCSNAVAAVTINNKPEFIEMAAPQIDFSRTVKLHEGRNEVRIAATGLNGRQSVTNLTIWADWAPPQISIERNAAAPALACRDDSTLEQVEVNGQAISIDGNVARIPLTSGPLHITAVDHAGNRIEWGLTEREILHLAQNRPPAPPALQMDDAGKTVTLCVPEYALDIRAEDDTALRSLRLNGKELLARSAPLFRSIQRIPLSLGTNHLSLVAEDYDGNQTEKAVTAIYRPPEYLDRIYRLAAATEPLSGEIPDLAFKRKASARIQQELTLDPVRFFLLAEENEQQMLQKELDLSACTWADPRAALKRSRKLHTDLTLIPRVLSDGEGQTVYIEVLDTQSGEKMFLDDVYLEDPDQISYQIEGLIMKVEQRFPLIQAALRQQNGKLLIDAGEERGTQKGMRFLVIRSPGDFQKGRIVRNGTRPAEVVASEIESTAATVIVPHGQAVDSAQPGDFVFSR